MDKPPMMAVGQQVAVGRPIDVVGRRDRLRCTVRSTSHDRTSASAADRAVWAMVRPEPNIFVHGGAVMTTSAGEVFADRGQ
jgi:hypothetical protein